MNQQRRHTETAVALRLWTYAEAVKALPYLRVVVGAVRDDWLTSLQARRRLRRLGRPRGLSRRRTLLQMTAARQDVEHAQDHVDDALRELQTLGVFAFDPVQGLALIPFGQSGALAWFVFDLFAAHGLEAWLFDDDPPETRRPLTANPRAALLASAFLNE